MFYHDKREPQPILDIEVKLTAVSGKHPGWLTDPAGATKQISDITKSVLKQDLDTYARARVLMEENRPPVHEVQMKIEAAVTDHILEMFGNNRLRFVQDNLESELLNHFGRNTTTVKVLMTPEPNFALKLGGYLGRHDVIVPPGHAPSINHPPPQPPAQGGGAVAVAPVVVAMPQYAQPPSTPAKPPVTEPKGDMSGGNGAAGIALGLLAIVAAMILFPRVSAVEAKVQELYERFRDLEHEMRIDDYNDRNSQSRRPPPRREEYPQPGPDRNEPYKPDKREEKPLQ